MLVDKKTIRIIINKYVNKGESYYVSQDRIIFFRDSEDVDFFRLQLEKLGAECSFT